MTVTTTLTAKQADALVAIHVAGVTGEFLRESNATGPGTINWPQVQKLQSADLIDVRGPGRHLFATPTGAIEAERIWPHAAYLTAHGYRHGDRLKLRRMGSNAVHLAPATAPRFYRATVLGADCLLAVDDPTIAGCGARLRGEVVAMEAAAGVGCATCRRRV